MSEDKPLQHSDEIPQTGEEEKTEAVLQGIHDEVDRIAVEQEFTCEEQPVRVINKFVKAAIELVKYKAVQWLLNVKDMLICKRIHVILVFDGQDEDDMEIHSFGATDPEETMNDFDEAATRAEEELNKQTDAEPIEYNDDEGQEINLYLMKCVCPHCEQEQDEKIICEKCGKEFQVFEMVDDEINDDDDKEAA